jgi:hypothetical protein
VNCQRGNNIAGIPDKYPKTIRIVIQPVLFHLHRPAPRIKGINFFDFICNRVIETVFAIDLHIEELLYKLLNMRLCPVFGLKHS